MLVDICNVSSHSFTQGSYKLIYSELSIPLVVKEVQVVGFRDLQVSTSSLAGATAALQVLRSISIPLFSDVLRQLNNLRWYICIFADHLFDPCGQCWC